MADWMAFVQHTYDVNPWVFLTLYVTTVPPVWYAVWRILLALRQGNRTALRRWALFLGSMVVIPYAYVLLVGRHLPWWVYPAVASVVALSAWEIAARVRKLGRCALNRDKTSVEP
jgi:hypothetical protein